jgi:hypothetical protein
VVHAGFLDLHRTLTICAPPGLTLSAAGSIASAMKSQTENVRRN